MEIAEQNTFKAPRNFSDISDEIDRLSEFDNTILWNFLKLFRALSLTEQEVRSLYLELNVTYDCNCIQFYSLCEKIGRNTGENFIKMCFTVYPNLLEEVFSENLDDDDDASGLKINWLRLILASDGYLPNIEVYDRLAESKNSFLLKIGVKFCSIDKLRQLKNSKNYLVREAAYNRLGPAECLSDMLSDKDRRNRLLGAKLSPVPIKKMSKISSEVDSQICNIFLKKCDNESVILFVANKNNKADGPVSNLIKFRMEQM